MKNKNEIRREAIVNKLLMSHQVSVKDLASQFNVSKETIRLDLEHLEMKGMLYRVHGGAVIRNEHAEIPLLLRKQERGDIKKALAKNLIRYIKDDSVLFVSSSSTNLYLSSLLKLKKNLTIFTNSFELVSMMQDTKHSLFVVGGKYYDNGKRMVGQYAVDMIQDIYFDMCICGMDGCKDLSGPATKSVIEHVFIKTVLEHSRAKVLISDQSKFDAFANYKFAEFSDFDLFFTDLLSKEHRNYFETHKEHCPKQIIEVEIW